MNILNFFHIKKYFKTTSKNNLSINSYLKNSRVIINGANNNLILKTSDIKRTKINIYGIDNSLFIDKDCHIRNLTIIILGNNLKIHIGKNCQIGEAQIVCAGDNSQIIIGENVLMAHKIEIRNNDGHSIYDKNGTLINKSKNIKICDRVWLAQGAKILKGVNIGQDSIVGMSSLVIDGNYPTNSILAGIPAKIVKENISWNMELPS